MSILNRFLRFCIQILVMKATHAPEGDFLSFVALQTVLVQVDIFFEHLQALGE